MNFPGHKYLGPGNPIDNGEPIDEDDRIAKTHDQAYEDARDDLDVRTADISAISSFSGDFLRTGNWHSAVGALGLAAKFGIETVTGVIYPSVPKSSLLSKLFTDNSPTKRPLATIMEGGEPASKKQKTEEPKSSHIHSESDNTILHHIHKPISQFKTGKLVFSHSRIMYTYGYQYKSIMAAETTEDSGKQLLLVTPYARVPCHTLPFYMTNNEFNNLPLGSKGKSFACVVTPLGFRTPFITNSAGINSVNSNLLVHGMFAFGLNNKYNGTNMNITTAASDPMIVTSIAIPKDDGCSIKDLWGIPIKKTDTALAFDNIPACFGNKKPLKSYYCQNVEVYEGGPGLPVLMNDMNIFTFMNGSGNPIIPWEYRPQVCVLKTAEPYPFFRALNGTAGSRHNIMYGSKVPFATAAIIDTDTSSKKFTFSKTENFVKQSIDIPYTTTIEQSGNIMHGLNEYGGGVHPPSLHVGVLPVNAYSTDVQDSKVQEVIALFKIDTMCEVEYSYDFTHATGNYVHPIMKVFGVTSGCDTASNNHYRDFALGYRACNPEAASVQGTSGR